MAIADLMKEELTRLLREAEKAHAQSSSSDSGVMNPVAPSRRKSANGSSARNAPISWSEPAERRLTAERTNSGVWPETRR
jgi:hypothetical protein